MAKLTKEKVTNCLKGSALTLATLAGVIGGVIFGLALRTREGKKFHSEEKIPQWKKSSFSKMPSQCTVWKFQDFSVIQILREINLWIM